MKLGILLMLSLFTVGYASKILVLTANFKSHVMYMGHMAKALASTGHDVTMVAGDTMPIMSEFEAGDIKWMKYRMQEKPFVEIPGNLPSLDNFKLASLNGLKTIIRMAKEMSKEVREMFDDGHFLQQVHEGKFDFAVVDPTVKSLLLLPYRLGIPYASLAVDFDPSAMCVPVFPSYVPNIMTAYSDRMSFFQRVVNFAASGAQEAIQLLMDDEGIKDTAKYAPERPPITYLTLQQQASLFFTLRAPGLHYVRGSLPNMLDVGGIMARPANSSNIHSDLRSIVDKATNGFIMVSFGSWMSQPEETILKFIQAFEATSLTVIWKSKDPPSNLPSNVKTVTWLPQNDLLGHPNIRSFITHCGGSSILETLFHGVPVIAVPLGVDQMANAALLKSRQLGIIINVKNFEVSELTSAIAQVTSPGNVYAESMSRVSAACKAMPNAGETASFWIDHVIQHGDRHLRAAAYGLERYQYFNIDVFAFTLLVMFMVGVLIKLSCRCVCRCLCKRKTKQD